MKKRELRSRILAKYDTFGEFAKEMGVTNVTVSNWVSSGAIPNAKIPKACEVLGIKQEEIGEVFFPETGKWTV